MQLSYSFLYRWFAVGSLLAAINVTFALAGVGKETGAPEQKKPTTNNYYSASVINSIYASIINNGDGTTEYPNGTGKLIIFEDGVVWGGYAKGLLKVGGSTYQHGLQAGRVLTPGTAGTSPNADDPALGMYRVFRVRPDVSPQTTFALVSAVLESDEAALIAHTNLAVQQIYNQYVLDWIEWPANQGAPFEDKNGNGIYEPNIDVPGIPGASQTLWFVANDLDASRSFSLAGSQPIGLEFQRTIWAYRSFGSLKDVVLFRNILINKSGGSIDSMFITQWSDPDLGDAGDDFAGCDTIRALGFVYNSKADAVYGTAVPAAGYKMISGPVVPGSPGDSAFVKFGYRKGFKNLKMSSFNIFINANANYSDPQMGNYNGTLQWFNLMKGLIGVSGLPYIDPITSQPSKFVLSGDPVANTGWLDGSFAAPGYRRIALTAGPFVMAAGDTQEFIVGLGVAQGTDRISSVAKLRSISDFTSSLVLKGSAEVNLGQVDSVQPFQSKVPFEASIIRLKGTTSNTSWFVQQKPGGSGASINTLSMFKAELQTDIPGIYRVGFVAISNSNVRDTVFVTFRVSSNKAPSVAFNAPTQITLGDTLKLDGTPTIDPELNPLTYSWSITGGESGSYEYNPADTVTGIFGNLASTQTTFVPTRSCFLTVTLQASDAEFTRSATKEIAVLPRKTANVSTGKVFDNHYMNPGIFGPFIVREFNGTYWARLFTLFSLDFGAADIAPLLLQGASGGNYFVATQQLVYSANGRFGAQIAILDGSGIVANTVTLDPDNSTVTKADTTATEVYVKNNRFYFSYGLPGLYVYDVTNPSSPQFVQQFTNGQRWGNFIYDGNYLFAAHPGRKISIVDISNPSTVTTKASYDLSWGPNRIAKSGATLVVANADTLELYDASNLTALTAHAKWLVPKEVRSDNRLTDIALAGNYLAISTYEGTYVYDVSNRDAPFITAKWITGIYQGRIFYNGNRLMVSVADRQGGSSPIRPYPLIELRIPPVTGVREILAGLPPTAYELAQNYPNPFNPSTTIRYALPVTSRVKLTVYNVLGQVVGELVNQEQMAGWKEVEWNSDVSSGIYFYRLEATSNSNNRFAQVKKMLLLR